MSPPGRATEGRLQNPHQTSRLSQADSLIEPSLSRLLVAAPEGEVTIWIWCLARNVRPGTFVRDK